MQVQIMDIQLVDNILSIFVQDNQNNVNTVSFTQLLEFKKNEGATTPLKCTCINKNYHGSSIDQYLLYNLHAHKQMILSSKMVKCLMAYRFLIVDNLKLTSDGRLIEKTVEKELIPDKGKVKYKIIEVDHKPEGWVFLVKRVDGMMKWFHAEELYRPETLNKMLLKSKKPTLNGKPLRSSNVELLPLKCTYLDTVYSNRTGYNEIVGYKFHVEGKDNWIMIPKNYTTMFLNEKLLACDNKK